MLSGAKSEMDSEQRPEGWRRRSGRLMSAKTLESETAVKRKVEVTVKSEEGLHPLSNGFPDTGKKRRVEVKMEILDVTPKEKGKNVDKTYQLDGVQPSLESTEEDKLEEQRLTYEEERNRILEENKKRMQELGLTDLCQQLSPTFRTQAHMKAAIDAKKRKNQIKLSIDAGFQPRRSGRHGSSKPLTFYQLKEEPGDYAPRRKSVSVRDTPKKPLRPTEEEVYTEEHIKLLGSYTNEWELFRDGYYSDGRRIYDPVNGKTCHQCRQKTLGQRTSCSLCHARSGEFCGDCIFMRYGENVLETRTNANWVCPVCRGICNCSICRVRRGWAPTGNLYRHALAEGFRSVAHYIIMTRQRQPEREERVHGGELTGVDNLEHTLELSDQKPVTDFSIHADTLSPQSQSASKIVARGVHDATAVKPQEKEAPLYKDFRCVESTSAPVVKVELDDAIGQEETRDGSTADRLQSMKQEECNGPNQDPAQIRKVRTRKGIDGTNVEGGIAVLETSRTQISFPKKKNRFIPGDDSALTSARARGALKNACLGLDGEGSHTVKEGSTNPKGVVSEGPKTLTTGHKKISAKDDLSATKLSGRSKVEIIRQRNRREASRMPSAASSCRTESICSRLRRKETINYKRFL